MPFTAEHLRIADVMVIRPQRHGDSRGYFIETYAKRDLHALGITIEFVQDNEALSTDRGTLRGLHFQKAPTPQAKLVRVISGSIFDVAVDLRAGSATYGEWCGTVLTAQEANQIFIPAGFAHGYCTLEANTLVSYKVDAFYDKAAEAGLRWNDPEIGIDWPIDAASMKISERDAVLPFLRDATAPFRF